MISGYRTALQIVVMALQKELFAVIVEAAAVAVALTVVLSHCCSMWQRHLAEVVGRLIDLESHFQNLCQLKILRYQYDDVHSPGYCGEHSQTRSWHAR